MVIQTFDKGYTVLSQILKEEDREIFLCKNFEVSKEKTYSVIRILNQELAETAVQFFLQKQKFSSMQDYIECFTYETQFYVVFIYSNAISLADKLEQEKCPLKERLEIGKKLVETMLIKNMPFCLQCDVLKKEHIRIEKNLDIKFHYTLENLKKTYYFRDITTSLYPIIEILFEEELRKKTRPLIEQFLQSLKEGMFEDYLELYREYNKLYTLSLQQPEKEVEEPKTILFSLWDKIKFYFHYIKIAFMVFLIIVSLFYMINTVSESKQVKEKQEVFTQIGTVQIK